MFRYLIYLVVLKHVVKFYKYWLYTGLLIFLINPVRVYSQTGGVTGYATRMGHNPIGLSMGNSLSAWATLESSALYNPALSTSIQKGVRLHPASSLMSFDRSLHSIEAGFPLPPTASLSLSVLHFRVSDIDGRSPSGYPTGSLSTSDFQLAGAFGISLSDLLKLGIGIKWNRADYHQDISAVSTIGVDLGLLIHTSERWTLAFVLQDLFASYSWDSGQLYGLEQGQSQKQSFARRIKVGSHLNLREFLDLTSEIELRNQPFQRSSYTMISDFGNPFLREIVTDETNRALIFRQGIAWKYHPNLTWRAGIETTDIRLDPEVFWSIGFSLYPPKLSFTPGIHYAYRNEPGKGSSIHAISFTFLF